MADNTINTSNRGFGGMPDKKQRKIASDGGKSSSDSKSQSTMSRSDAGKKGAAAQSRDDKIKGGENSHLNDS